MKDESAADPNATAPALVGDDPARLDRAVRLAVYRHFCETGMAPDVAAVAGRLQVPPPAVQATLQRLAASHTLVLQPGTDDLWMAMPFSAVPTAFRVTTASGSWWANCAWDALGIPAMLGTDGTVATTCADCDAPLTLQVRQGALDPSATVIHFAVPAARWWDDIGST